MRVDHLFSASVTWHGLNEAAEFVPPLIFDRNASSVLPDWFKQQQPDVIVASEETVVRDYDRILKLSVPGPVAFATTSIGPESGRSSPIVGGIDELPAEIGAAAVDLLASMIERRVQGLPVPPASTLLAGRCRIGGERRSRE